MHTPIKIIEILGPGCARCRETHRVVQEVVRAAGLDCAIVKNESIDRLVELGALATPAVACDGRLLVSGRVPAAAEIRKALGLS